MKLNSLVPQHNSKIQLANSSVAQRNITIQCDKSLVAQRKAIQYDYFFLAHSNTNFNLITP